MAKPGHDGKYPGQISTDGDWIWVGSDWERTDVNQKLRKVNNAPDSTRKQND
ncbi:hypothetical protein [Aeromicrobium sp. Root344]|uniref:hypothetical protein n=1 Tax=Aeromicrobium sp. Root344 TaxID=1736521 RepID=UPI000A5B68EC|nr:hypothetical protein [Aeromicrobium sp. Root344]